MRIGSDKRVLFYGIGNVGREDDGLGIYFIDVLEKINLSPNIKLQSNYQLNIEDALEISNYDLVIFIDATQSPEAKTPCEFLELQSSSEISFTTHAMSMESVLGLCEQLYNKKPKSYLLAIPGYEWGINNQLSTRAKSNLMESINVIQNLMKG